MDMLLKKYIYEKLIDKILQDFDICVENDSDEEILNEVEILENWYLLNVGFGIVIFYWWGLR